ncbi:hypothetical protein AVEN_176927-1 [Araneus ventricosus]|uniref:Uncharacterized protein n=1 Tax=Araneus ventricosus TaxID=182803 RepID=A0A4Y2K6I0_ARAVE|nr:hypothetical protein AVEN_176927-1 [Araneus ventricosus]
MRGGRLRISLTTTSATADASSRFPAELSACKQNMASRTDDPAKCELRSVIRFLQAEGWFMENDQCSCFFSDLTMTAKSYSDFWSCPHS